MYYAVQGTTLLILVLAANTSFQGFPRLSALLARDRFAPRQFSNLGDRLVFSNGMLVLTGAAAALLVIYKANTNSLIHLYVIGVFTAFTISQAGMVRYWQRVRTPGWHGRLIINTVGAAATGLVTLIVIWTKFGEGAWLVTVAIPILVFVMLGVRRHYGSVARRLQAGTAAVASAPDARNRTLLVVEGLEPATERALAFARRISADGGLRAIHVPRRHTDPGISPRWFHFADGNPLLETLDSRNGAAEAVLEQVWQLPRGESDFVTVVIPEQFHSRSLVEQARHPFELALKFRLLTENGVVVVDVPTVDEWPNERPLAVRIFASGANAASMRAVNWAVSVGLPNTRAVNFAFDDEEAAAIRREWRAEGVRVPLEVLAAPVPGHRRPAPRLPARPDRRWARGARCAPRAHPPWLGAPAPQPASALRQAAPARRAARHPRLGPLSAAAMRLRPPDPRALSRRARRLARWTGSIAYRSIVVPLLELEETEHALDLACRLAADRGARIVLVAPLVVERELPIDAHFDAERAVLEERLTSAATAVGSRGVTLRQEIVRTRPGTVGDEVARVAAERRAELLVVGAPVKSRRGFRRPFPAEILPLLRATPCRVLIATGPVAGQGAAPNQAEFSKILVPMKLGEIGEEMVATAVKLAQERGAAVVALHVIRVPLDQPLDADASRRGGHGQRRRSPRPPLSVPTTVSKSSAAPSAPARSAKRSCGRWRRVAPTSSCSAPRRAGGARRASSRRPSTTSSETRRPRCSSSPSRRASSKRSELVSHSKAQGTRHRLRSRRLGRSRSSSTRRAGT